MCNLCTTRSSVREMLKTDINDKNECKSVRLKQYDFMLFGGIQMWIETADNF